MYRKNSEILCGLDVRFSVLESESDQFVLAFCVYQLQVTLYRAVCLPWKMMAVVANNRLQSPHLIRIKDAALFCAPNVWLHLGYIIWSDNEAQHFVKRHKDDLYTIWMHAQQANKSEVMQHDVLWQHRNVSCIYRKNIIECKGLNPGGLRLKMSPPFHMNQQ